MRPKARLSRHKPASELLFHSSAQLEAARAAAQVSKQAATQAAVEDEMRAPHAVGDVVYVKTFAPGGEQHFRAEVLAVRDIFPPVQVKFLSTLAGDTNPLALPAPLTAFVTADKIDTTAPAGSLRSNIAYSHGLACAHCELRAATRPGDLGPGPGTRAEKWVLAASRQGQTRT